MNLKQLEYFVHVAELGSFSKAAVLTASGVAASARSGELVVRGLVEPAPMSVLCVAILLVRGLPA